MPDARLRPPPPIAEFKILKELFTPELPGRGAGGGTLVDLEIDDLLLLRLLFKFLEPNFRAEIPGLCAFGGS